MALSSVMRATRRLSPDGVKGTADAACTAAVLLTDRTVAPCSNREVSKR